MAKALGEFEALRAAVHQQRTVLQAIAADDAEPSAAREAAQAYLASSVTPPTATLELTLSRPRVGVAALVTCPQYPGMILIGERKGSHGAGRWAVPGGHMEGGEEWAVTAARELQEETGLSVPSHRFRFVTATNDIMAAEHLHYITIFLLAEITKEEADVVANLEPEKCLGWHWLLWADVSSKPLFTPMMNFIAGGFAIALASVSAPKSVCDKS